MEVANAKATLLNLHPSLTARARKLSRRYRPDVPFDADDLYQAGAAGVLAALQRGIRAEDALLGAAWYAMREAIRTAGAGNSFSPAHGRALARGLCQPVKIRRLRLTTAAFQPSTAATLPVRDSLPPAVRLAASLKSLGFTYRDIQRLTGVSPRRAGPVIRQAVAQIRREPC